MKNILISNDDGVLGPGILATKQALEGIANTVVVGICIWIHMNWLMGAWHMDCLELLQIQLM